MNKSKTNKTTCIADHDSPDAPVAGARRVQWFVDGAWIHKGWLMPTIQPTIFRRSK